MATLKYRLVGDDPLLPYNEVEVDDVACNGYFLLTVKGPVTELVPAHLLAEPAVVIQDEPETEDNGEVS
jgi:hypothetical protein